ncbi:MAG: metallophosphoesterase [Candidatus Nanoarchaeia archaeon]|jgi:DNA repair exonuclease SbcCD nuclease subunit|nr:metallophosphoesterase [Candidatus Nanoarchaeia archaeon]
MEIVLLSDIHLGRYKYGKINNKGYDTRTQDILDNIQQAFDYAIINNVKSIAILGDFYHTKRPDHIFRRLLSSKIEWALKNNVTLYLLLGNHDQGKTHAHDLVELVELSSQIKNFYVVEKPSTFETEDAILCFIPHVNPLDENIQHKDFNDYIIENIRDLTDKARKSTKKLKFLFGHYATSKSVAGRSFDMGMDEKSNRVLPIEIFDETVWTKVYLGDIHKPQELNNFCRHVGSIARVDFGEENDKKGFYHVIDNKDKFIELNDREFKTLSVNLLDDPRKQMGEFCELIQKLDLSKSIVRLHISIKESDKTLISFSGLEQFLKETCWNYIGKNIQEVRESKKEIIIKTNEELNYITMFREYTNSMEISLKEEVLKTGEEILFNLMN